jgi:hypothetical protein
VQLLGRLPFFVGFLGHAYAVTGNHTEAQEILREMLELASRKHIDAFSIAVVYAGLGEDNHALDWLENACEHHSGWLTQRPSWQRTTPDWMGSGPTRGSRTCSGAWG